jgi:5-formyltetrahydrofolate cyclo-ligase
MTDPLTEKKRLRAAALARRDGLDPGQRASASRSMAAAAAVLAPAPGVVVSGYWPIRSEADPRPLMEALRDRGASICLPAILDRETIVFRRFERGQSLVPMGFGTLGPGPDAAAVDPSLMLVPLAAFDRGGSRLGYGAGFYDRAIARLHAAGVMPRLVGIAFDCQEVTAVPAEPHDIALDEILSESGLRRFDGR